MLVAALAQTHEREGADGFELGVAELSVGAFGRNDERLVDERRDGVAHRLSTDRAVGAHLLGCLEVATAGEQRESLEDASIHVAEKVVTPSNRCVERSMVRCRVSTGVANDGEHVVEPPGELRQRHGPRACGRELDREWQPVESPHDVGDERSRRVVEAERRTRGAGTLDEERARGAVEQRVRCGARRGEAERRECKRGLAVDGKRLTARREHGEARAGTREIGGESRRGREHVLAVVEHDKHARTGEVPREDIGGRGTARTCNAE
jgi:hypothetical protein